MALYTPDYIYQDAMKIVDKLGNSKKDLAIKYYIEKNRKWHEKDKKKIEKYEKFFELLNALLPNNNGINRRLF